MAVSDSAQHLETLLLIVAARVAIFFKTQVEVYNFEKVLGFQELANTKLVVHYPSMKWDGAWSPTSRMGLHMNTEYQTDLSMGNLAPGPVYLEGSLGSNTSYKA